MKNKDKKLGTPNLVSSLNLQNLLLNHFHSLVFHICKGRFWPDHAFVELALASDTTSIGTSMVAANFNALFQQFIIKLHLRKAKS